MLTLTVAPFSHVSICCLCHSVFRTGTCSVGFLYYCWYGIIEHQLTDLRTTHAINADRSSLFYIFCQDAPWTCGLDWHSTFLRFRPPGCTIMQWGRRGSLSQSVWDVSIQSFNDSFCFGKLFRHSLKNYIRWPILFVTITFFLTIVMWTETFFFILLCPLLTSKVEERTLRSRDPDFDENKHQYPNTVPPPSRKKERRI